ncbi:MAG: MmgE/PrpD family protein [Dehalococcoidia bacterium]
MSERPIATILGEFVASTTYGSLPPEVQQQAKLRLLDTLACAVAGRDLPWSRLAVSLVAGNHGASSVIAHNVKAPAGDAALANGVLAHSILEEDTGGVGHPSTIVVPAALAVAEERRSSGQEFLVAVAMGYEVMARAAWGSTPQLIERGFRSSPVFGILGAAAAAGKLLRLDGDGVATALGYAANVAGGLTQGWWSGTMETMFHAGVAARNGILAAALAHHGATVAADTLEGRHGYYRAFAGDSEGAQRLVADLGHRYGMLETTQKPYPACALNQVPIDLGLSLRERGVDPDQVERVVERVSAMGKTYPGSNVPPPYHSMFQAQMSAQFCLAAALLGKPVTDPTFYFQHYDDPDIAALAGKVELVGEADRSTYQLRIEVFLRDGRQVVIEEDRSARLRPTVEDTVQRFQSLAGGPLGPRARQVAERVLALDQASDLTEVMALTAAP